MSCYSNSLSNDGNRQIITTLRQEAINSLDQFLLASKKEGRYGDVVNYAKNKAFDVTKILVQKGVSTFAGETIGGYVGPTMDFLREKAVNKYIYGDENCEKYASQLEKNIQIINISDPTGIESAPRYIGINNQNQVVFESLDIKEMHSALVTYALTNRLLKEGDFIQNLSPFVCEFEKFFGDKKCKVIRFQNGVELLNEDDPDFKTYQLGIEALNARTLTNQSKRNKQIVDFIELIARNSSIIKDPTQETFASKPLPQSISDMPALSLPFDDDDGEPLSENWIDLGSNHAAISNSDRFVSRRVDEDE